MSARRPILCWLAVALVAPAGVAPATAENGAPAPHLRKQGTATQLMVDGKRRRGEGP